MTRLVWVFMIACVSYGQFIAVRDPRWRTVGVGQLSNRPAGCAASRDVWICVGEGCSTGLSIHYCREANTWQEVGGADGGVGGSGTSGRLPVWTGESSIGDSSMVEESGRILSYKPLHAPAFVGTGDPPQVVELKAVGGGSISLSPSPTSGTYTLTLPAASAVVSVQGHTHSADDLVSGVVGLNRGGTGNSSWVAGRCVQVSSDGTQLESASGACGAGGGFDILDATTLWLREDFCSGAATSGQVGELGWTRSTVQGTATGPDYGKGAANNPCTVSFGVSTTNANDGATLNLGLNQSPFHDATGRGNWEAVFIWQYQDPVTEMRTRVGLTQFDQHNVLVPTSFMGLRLDHDASWDPGGTTFIACVCNGSTKANCTDYNTGVTVSQGSWYKLRIWSDSAGVIRMSVNDGSTITFNNPSTLPSTTTDFQPVYIMGRTGGTGNRRLVAEFFAARVTGLAR